MLYRKRVRLRTPLFQIFNHYYSFSQKGESKASKIQSWLSLKKLNNPLMKKNTPKLLFWQSFFGARRVKAYCTVLLKLFKWWFPSVTEISCLLRSKNYVTKPCVSSSINVSSPTLKTAANSHRSFRWFPLTTVEQIRSLKPSVRIIAKTTWLIHHPI